VQADSRTQRCLIKMPQLAGTGHRARIAPSRLADGRAGGAVPTSAKANAFVNRLENEALLIGPIVGGFQNVLECFELGEAECETGALPKLRLASSPGFNGARGSKDKCSDSTYRQHRSCAHGVSPMKRD
jgi:hypothetical protein